MFRVIVRSRVGNFALGVLGVLYFFASSATLAYYIISNWGANGLFDFVLQGALFVGVVVSVFFVGIAVQNLEVRRRALSERTSPTTPEHQKPAAAGL